MIYILIIVFAVTLVYLSVTERAHMFNGLIALQGLLLCGIAFIELKELDWPHLTLILLETLVFKAVVIPWFVSGIIRRNRFTEALRPTIPGYQSLIIVSAIILGVFLFSNTFHEDQIAIKFFTVAMATIFSGLFLVMIHKQVLAHMLGYLVMENGIFLLSLSIGDEMPLVVNMAILLDIFTSVLLLGLFINRLGHTFRSVSVDDLQSLKD